MSSVFQSAGENTQAHTDSVWGCCFSKNDSIVTISADQTAKAWRSTVDQVDIKTVEKTTNSLLFELKPHILCPISVAASPSSNIVATSSFDGNIRIFDMTDGHLIKEINLGPTELWAIAFSHDGKSIATSNYNGTIKLWKWNEDISFDMYMNSTLTQYQTTNLFALSMDFSSNGKYIATGHADGTVNVFNLNKDQDRELKSSLKKHSADVRALKFSPTGNQLFSGSNDMSINCYDCDEEGHYNLLRTYQGHTGYVLGLDITKDGAYMASVSTDKTCKIWEVETGECIQTITSNSIIWSVAFNSTGNKLVYTTEKGSFSILIRKTA